MAYFYTERERSLFTDRAYQLDLLRLVEEDLVAGRNPHLAFVGLRRIGKTLLLKEFIHQPHSPDVIPVYLDLKKLTLTPEHFSLQYIGTLLFWLLERGGGFSEAFLSPSSLIRQAARLGHGGLLRYLEEFTGELEKAKINYHAVLSRAFNFPEVVSQALGKKIMVFIDEFQDLGELSRYPSAPRVLDLFRSLLQEQSGVSYIVSGSAISLMERIFQSAGSPLFLHFRVEHLGPFTEEDSRALALKIAPDLSPSALGLVTRWTWGHPFYVYALVERARTMAKLFGRRLEGRLLKEAFAVELLTSGGMIYHLCTYLFEESIGKARGKSQLRDILRIIAKAEEPLTLTDIARGLKRPAGHVANLLKRLLDVDILVMEDRTYRFRDPVLRIWLSYFYEGMEFDMIPKEEVLGRLADDLSERYARISAELGPAKEAQIRELIRAFDGRRVEGAYFGERTPVTLPHFENVGAFRTADGAEIDVLASEGQRWAVEIKWRNRRSDKRDVEAFVGKAKALADQLWFISKEGFTEGAMEVLSARGVLFSSAREIERLAKELGVRFKR